MYTHSHQRDKEMQPYLASQPKRNEHGVNGQRHFPLCFRPNDWGSINCLVKELESSSIVSIEVSGTLAANTGLRTTAHETTSRIVIRT